MESSATNRPLPGHYELTRGQIAFSCLSIGSTVLLWAWLGSRIKTHPYIRKTQLVALVEESLVDPICNELIKKNQTGKHGDGKIFIMPAA